MSAQSDSKVTGAHFCWSVQSAIAFAAHAEAIAGETAPSLPPPSLVVTAESPVVVVVPESVVPLLVEPPQPKAARAKVTKTQENAVEESDFMRGA
jgi:hypothetical protein